MQIYRKVLSSFLKTICFWNLSFFISSPKIRCKTLTLKFNEPESGDMFKSIKIEDSVEEQVEIETDDIFIEDDLDKVMFERFWFEWGHIYYFQTFIPTLVCNTKFFDRNLKIFIH